MIYLMKVKNLFLTISYIQKDNNIIRNSCNTNIRNGNNMLNNTNNIIQK